MLSKGKIKFIRLLHLNKYRRKQGLFLAEGSVNVLDFLSGPLKVKELFATRNWLDKQDRAVLEMNPEVVSLPEMAKISALKTPSEVLAIVEKPEYSLPDIADVEGYVLVLDDIRDPGNLGTILRTADWFGIREVICSPDTVDAYNPKVVQATMGSLGRVRVHYTDLPAWLAGKPEGLNVYGAVLQGDDIRRTKKTGRGILLVGSEAHGISKTLYPYIDQYIRIPSAGTSGAESLNAAVATAIVCYAFCKPEI